MSEQTLVVAVAVVVAVVPVPELDDSNPLAEEEVEEEVEEEPLLRCLMAAQ